MKFGTWGIPPARGGTACQASRQSIAFEAGITDGEGDTTGASGGFVIVDGAELGCRAGLDAGGEEGRAVRVEHAAAAVTAKPAVAARRSSPRRLIPEAGLDRRGRDASIRERYVRGTSSLWYPHIVAVHDRDEDDGLTAIAELASSADLGKCQQRQHNRRHRKDAVCDDDRYGKGSLRGVLKMAAGGRSRLPRH
jgi:hypothetical protein